MSIQLPERVRGLDGKTYPSYRWRGEDLAHVIGRCHYLAHDEGLSVRQIVARLAAEGITRSVGSVSEYLSRNHCVGCSGDESVPPEQPHTSWRRAAEPDCSGYPDEQPEQHEYSERVGELITQHRQMRGTRPSAHQLSLTIAEITEHANYYVSDSFAAMDDGSITPGLVDELAAVAEHLIAVAKHLRGNT